MYISNASVETVVKILPKLLNAGKGAWRVRVPTVLRFVEESTVQKRGEGGRMYAMEKNELFMDSGREEERGKDRVAYGYFSDKRKK